MRQMKAYEDIVGRARGMSAKELVVVVVLLLVAGHWILKKLTAVLQGLIPDLAALLAVAGGLGLLTAAVFLLLHHGERARMTVVGSLAAIGMGTWGAGGFANLGHTIAGMLNSMLAGMGQ